MSFFHLKLTENTEKPKAIVKEVVKTANPALLLVKLIESIISLPLRVHDIGTKSSRIGRVEELMHMVGLPSRLIHSYPNQLSGGQRQRVALARAVLRRPRVLVLDEAMSGLEPAGEAELRASLSASIPGATTIVITHRVDSIEDSEEVLLISGGQVVWQGTCGDLRARPKLLREVIA